MASKDIKIFLKTVADSTGLTKIGTFLKKHISEVNVLKAAYVGLHAAATTLNKGFHLVADGLRKAAIGTAAGVGASVREFYVWNKEASRAWTMMDVGRGRFEELRREISKLAPELGVAKSELGKGWYQALSAGVSEDQLIPFLRTAAKVAVADGSSFETAIDGITTVLNAYGMESARAAEATDLMFKAVRYGKTTFGDLAAYIAQAAPTASALGVGLDQVLAAVATLTKQGVPTATAMTQIRNSMLALNGELGDGWAKSMTLQDALEKVGSEAGYSAVALEKAFGRENVGAVLALIGDNAAKAADDLALMRAAGGGLEEAFGKVDSQVGSWPRLWESIRAAISDIGEKLEQKLKPVVDFIAGKLNSIRDSGGFATFVDRIAAKIGETVQAAVAGVQTVIEVLGKTTVGGAISGAIAALVDLAVTLIAEGLRSLGTVVVALAKVFAAALRGEIMKIDIWGRDELGQAREAARKNIANLAPEQREALGVPEDLAGGSGLMSPEKFKDLKRRQREYIDSLSLDQAVSIATANRDQDIGAALNQAGESFAASRDRLGTAGGRIVDGLSRRTGVDVSAVYDANLAAVRGASSPAGSAAAPAQGAQSVAPAMPQAGGAGADAARSLKAHIDQLGEDERETLAAVRDAVLRMSERYAEMRSWFQNIPNS